MLIVNADDYGRNRLATERIVACTRQGSVTSTSAMVFMEDSQRAAELAAEQGIVPGLHVNLTEELTQMHLKTGLRDCHSRVARFLTRNNYNQLIFNPALRRHFGYIFHAQREEYERLYNAAPSHIDGHHHMHLCANMLFGNFVQKGQRVRRNLTFARGEKGFANRMYRACIDRWLAGKYVITDCLFSLPEILKAGRLALVRELARSSNVELETHPEREEEYKWLMGVACGQAFSGLQKGTYTQLNGGV